VSLEPVDRRQFLTVGGGAFICTLAGQRIPSDEPADLPKLARGVKTPPKVATAEAGGSTVLAGSGETSAAATAGIREHWIRAEEVRWDIVPTGRDQMMDRRVRGKTRFTAYAFRPYTAEFAAPAGPPTLPGPLIEADTGETIVVHLQNAVDVPVTMHPHGIFYSDEMDGSYKGRFTDPGGFVQPGRRFTYVWDAQPGTEGTWLYHDHGPLDPLPTYKGLFGPLVVRDPATPRPDRDFFLFMHALQPPATGLRNAFSCINGRAYAGNTPTLRAAVGERVRFHVFALDDDFHTFHLHGHRWTDPGAGVIDTKTLGPAESYAFELTEDNPGRWFYHCHVFTHLHMGMNGWYVVG
jgi:FtsP/CotA-like multicopper oxidase with cupredoxin domain